MREGDVLVVWSWTVSPGSLRQLIDPAEDLGARGIGLGPLRRRFILAYSPRQVEWAR